MMLYIEVAERIVKSIEKERDPIGHGITHDQVVQMMETN